MLKAESSTAAIRLKLIVLIASNVNHSENNGAITPSRMQHPGNNSMYSILDGT